MNHDGHGVPTVRTYNNRICDTKRCVYILEKYWLSWISMLRTIQSNAKGVTQDVGDVGHPSCWCIGNNPCSHVCISCNGNLKTGNSFDPNFGGRKRSMSWATQHHVISNFNSRVCTSLCSSYFRAHKGTALGKHWFHRWWGSGCCHYKVSAGGPSLHSLL